ncbi:HD-GYP domain-containing protein [Aquincola tertiaricarbonis]|uniref:HD-GYP domain-containing protein n=1 Tax=Aquincola tertiaricarbonis TaxID=391953 RepID=UPI0006151E5A|nr:HD-GYP domain-containing protein [Aquincola tertiaricarbonis]
MLKRITTDQLRIGMFIQELGGSWMSHPFWRSKFLLTDEKTLAKVVESGVPDLVIDTARGLDVPAVAAAPAPAPPMVAPPAEPGAAPEPPHTVLPPVASPDYRQAAALCDRSLVVVNTLFHEARMGNAIDAEHCVPVVQEVIDSVAQNPTTLTSLARLKTANGYAYMHAVAVCALMVSLARTMGLTPEQTREAGLAGLMLDIGKTRMPPELHDKPGRLTDAEQAQFQAHVRHGQQLLLEAGGFSEAVIDVALHHHERVDGAGYPDKLAGDRISLLSRMAAVCDVYDAVTSRRPYHAPWDPAEAMSHLARTKGQFDTRVFHSFVKSVGVYPNGSLVRLRSERLAVVRSQGLASLLAPKVAVFYSVAERHALEPFELDLADAKADDKITGIESPEAWRFKDLDRLWLGPLK